MMTSTIIGRETHLDSILEHLANARLVTILGTGGVGKTSLARALVEQLPDGADWIDLAMVAIDSDVGAATNRMLGTSSIEAYAVTHADRRPLIVIDNCEHVHDAARALVEELLAAHSEIRILATSRTELGADGEIRYRLPPLPVRSPTDSLSPAAELFLLRSRSAGASWPESVPNLAAVEAIVGRVDGIPLAIELAAAQAVAIAPAELEGLMKRSLDVLADPSASSGNHRSLRAVVGASYERLDETSQRFFRAIAPLGFPFDLDLAARMADVDQLVALNLISGLRRESLLTVEHAEDGSSRFRLLEPIREFALEQLVGSNDAAENEDRFVDVMAAFADEVVAIAIGSFDLSVLARAAERFAHIVRALEITLRRDETPARAYRLVLPLFAPSSGPRLEVAAMGARIHDRWPDATDPLRAEALAVIAHTAMNVGDVERATELATIARHEPTASPVGRLLAFRTLGSIAAFEDDYDAATAYLEEALVEATAFQGLFAREMRTTVLGFRVDDLTSIDELAVLGDEAAADEDYVTLGWVLVAMTNMYLHSDRLVEARRCLDRAELIIARSPLSWTESSIARSRALVAAAEKDWQAAAAAWLRCIELMVAWGDVEGVAVCIRSAAASAEACGEHDVAERLWRSRPIGRANTILPRPFIDEEQQLLDRCGPPLPVGLREAVESARSALAESNPPPTDASGGQVIRFEGDCEIDLERRQLRREGESVHVEPQVFDVLVHLARNTGRLVSREELMDEVWGSRFVSAAAVNSRIRSARVATGDDGKRQAVIRTVHGRGFEFVAEITSESVQDLT